MVKIRLRRVGAKKQPSYRVVVADSRSPRDGRFIETIGHYNPRVDPPTVVIQEDRALYWLSVGAQPTEPVARFFEKLGLADKLAQVHAGAAITDVATPMPDAPAKTKKAKSAVPAAPTADEAAAAPEAKAETPTPKAKAPEAKAAAPKAEAAVEAVAAPAEAVAAPAEAAVAESDEAAAAPAAAVQTPAVEEVVEEVAAGGLAALGLSGRVQSALEAAGVDSVADLRARASEGDDALIALPGIGAKAVEEIREKLADDQGG